MKLMQEDQVIYGNTAQATTFKIASSTKAFKILSSNLYKNKIRAIVRELTCNALDAHRLKGNVDESFVIKAPVEIDPRFVIRDFGPGISHEDILEMYTTYFASTKDQSNDFTGALGLGSKSPFSYTETFSVTSYHNGRVRGYTALIINGEPSIKPTFDEPMSDTDKTGLEVTVPVKMSDINRWHEEIRYCIRPFTEYKPNVVGLEINEKTYLPLDDYFTDNDFRNEFEHSGVYAVYGNIIYPLNDVYGIDYQWLSYRNDTMYFRFPLGELDIAPSREELSFDEETVKNILAVVNKKNDEDLTESIKHMLEITNKRELLRLFDEFGYKAKSLIESKVKFGDKTLDEVKNEIALDSTSLCEYLKMNSRLYKVHQNEALLCKYKTQPDYRWKKTHVSPDRIFGYNHKTVNVLIDDIKNRNLLPTLRGMAKSSIIDSGDCVVVLSAENKLMDSALDKIKEFMGEDEVKVFKASELTGCRDVDLEYQEQKLKNKEEKRPASPNVFEYKLNSDSDNFSFYSYTESRMTSKELEQLDASVPVIILYRDDIVGYDDTSIFIKNGEDYLHELCQFFKIKKFYAVRNNVVGRLRKTDRPCLKTILCDKLVEHYQGIIDKGDFPAPDNKCWLSNNISRIPDLHYIGEKYIGVNLGKTKQYSRLDLVRGHLRAVPEELVKVANRYNHELLKVEDKLDEGIDKFRESFKLVSFMLDRKNLSVTDTDIINEIIEIVKP